MYVQEIFRVTYTRCVNKFVQTRIDFRYAGDWTVYFPDNTSLAVIVPPSFLLVQVTKCSLESRATTREPTQVTQSGGPTPAVRGSHFGGGGTTYGRTVQV